MHVKTIFLEQPMTGEEEIRAQRIAAVHDAWVQSKVMVINSYIYNFLDNYSKIRS